MLLTEEQANKTVCAHMRYCVNPLDVAQDHAHPVYTNGYCMAKDCAQWRWFDGSGQVRITSLDADGPGPEWIKAGETKGVRGEPVMRWRLPNLDRLGFCGLSGIPQVYD